jgi:hypothetical protein
MQGISWTGVFAPSDAALERYAAFADRLPAW